MGITEFRPLQVLFLRLLLLLVCGTTHHRTRSKFNHWTRWTNEWMKAGQPPTRHSQATYVSTIINQHTLPPALRKLNAIWFPLHTAITPTPTTNTRPQTKVTTNFPRINIQRQQLRNTTNSPLGRKSFQHPSVSCTGCCWCCGGIRWFGNWSYWSSALLVTRHFISHRRAVWPFKRRSVSISGRLFSRNSIQNALAVGGCSGGVTDGG